MRLENIGILQFLQSLLVGATQNKEKTEQPPTEKEQEKTPETHDDSARLEQNRSAQDAVLRFLEAHEQRANRHKK